MNSPASIDGEVRGGRHVMQVRVYYDDTDFSGIVYHASYLRGRLLTGAAFKHLGLAEPARDPAQFGLFGGEEE